MNYYSQEHLGSLWLQGIMSTSKKPKCTSSANETTVERAFNQSEHSQINLAYFAPKMIQGLIK